MKCSECYISMIIDGEVARCPNSNCNKFNEIIRTNKFNEIIRTRTKQQKYYREGVEIKECSGCYKFAIFSQMGKMMGFLYCQSCYLQREQSRINEWKSAYKHHMNGKEEDRIQKLMTAPKLSSFLN